MSKMMCLALAVAGMACASVATATPKTIPVDRSFSGINIVWNGNADGPILFKAVEAGGETFVCGAYLGPRGIPGNIVRESLRASQIVSGTTPLAQNVSYFKKVTVAGLEAGTAKAKCRKSRVGWQPSFAKDLEFRSLRTRFRE